MDGFTPVEDDPQVVALKSRDEQLAARIAALSADVEEKRVKALTMFRDNANPKFEGYNWKAALSGATVDLPVKAAGMTIFVRLATGQTAQAVAAYLAELNGPITTKGDEGKIAQERRASLLPVTSTEAALLQRVAGIEVNGQRLDLSALPLDSKLQRLRTFSSPLLNMLVDRCELLESWLNAQMELDAGN